MVIINDSYSVYIHANIVSGKMYVGISKNIKERWRCKGKNYIESPKFYNAIKKYGWDNFEHIIFASNLTREQACNMEKILIKQLDTINNGYNISEGGDCFIITDEHRKKLSKLAKERFSNIPFTDDHKNKISATRTKFAGCVEGKKPIRCVQTGEVYESVSAAAKAMNIPHSSISNVLTGKRNHTHNYHFTYCNL